MAEQQDAAVIYSPLSLLVEAKTTGNWGGGSEKKKS
jgi:hypothetical protein